jgi:hypothetical protein
MRLELTRRAFVSAVLGVLGCPTPAASASPARLRWRLVQTGLTEKGHQWRGYRYG